MQRRFNRFSPRCQRQPSLDTSLFRGGTLAACARAIDPTRGIGRRWRNWLVCHQRLPRRRLLMPLSGHAFLGRLLQRDQHLNDTTPLKKRFECLPHHSAQHPAAVRSLHGLTGC